MKLSKFTPRPAFSSKKIVGMSCVKEFMNGHLNYMRRVSDIEEDIFSDLNWVGIIIARLTLHIHAGAYKRERGDSTEASFGTDDDYTAGFHEIAGLVDVCLSFHGGSHVCEPIE